jgi:ketosteroid isomerase-like protein
MMHSGPVRAHDRAVTERVDLVVRGIRATLVGDSTVVADLFTDDVRATMSTSVWSAPGLAVEIEDRAGAFENVDVHVQRWRTLDDELWVEWTASVFHVGPLAVEDTVIAPTHRWTELHGMTIAEFRGNRIDRFRQYWDCAALMGAGESGRPTKGRLQRG